MNLGHRSDKQAIRNFLQAHYTDERLTMLLAHTKDGKLNYSSCCCLIGIVTANHALQTIDRCQMSIHGEDHLAQAKSLSGAREAEMAFLCLGSSLQDGQRNPRRNRILIPIIRAEMRRRDKARKRIEWKQELMEVST